MVLVLQDFKLNVIKYIKEHFTEAAEKDILVHLKARKWYMNGTGKRKSWRRINTFL